MEDRKKTNDSQRIHTRLRKNFNLITNITSISIVLAIILIEFTSVQFNHSLKSYGFIQGDIGKASALCVIIFIVSAIIGLALMFASADHDGKKKKKKRG